MADVSWVLTCFDHSDHGGVLSCLFIFPVNLMVYQSNECFLRSWFLRYPKVMIQSSNPFPTDRPASRASCPTWAELGKVQSHPHMKYPPYGPPKWIDPIWSKTKAAASGGYSKIVMWGMAINDTASLTFHSLHGLATKFALCRLFLNAEVGQSKPSFNT